MSGTQWIKCCIIKDDELVFSKMDVSLSQIYKNIKQSLRTRLKSGSLKPDDIVQIKVQDGSGYFSTCPEIFSCYYNETRKVSEFLEVI